MVNLYIFIHFYMLFICGGAIDNRYGYLLLNYPDVVLYFEGASKMRGA